MRFVLFICGLLLLTVGVTSCGDKKERVTDNESLPIGVAYPEVRDVTLTEEYPGYLSASATVDLVGRVNGLLIKNNVKAGSRVKRGDLIYVIEPEQYRDALSQSESNLKTAEAELAYARSSYERMKEVIKSDAVSEIQLLQSEANVKKCEAAVSSAQAELASARTTLGYCYVKSPIDGLITRSNYSVGNYISGEATPVKLATVYKDDFLYAYFHINNNRWMNERVARMLTKGGTDTLNQTLTIGLGESGEEVWDATLDYLSPNVTLSTGTIEVRAKLMNPDGVLKTGSYVSITLPVEEVKQGVLIPEASIGTDQLGKYIYVVDESDVVHYRPIVQGELVEDTLRLIEKGLKPRERYVTRALMKVRDGMHVNPIQQP